MVAGRTPASTWQAVAAKVVAANRMRRGLGKEVRIEDFQIEELGGRAGRSIFGPVAVFNGRASFRVKKPLKGITVSVTFHGVTEVDGEYVSFMTESKVLYSGDLIQAGLRNYLFAFEFPHVNLPPSSDHPLIAYSFTGKLAVDDRPESRETLPFSHTAEIMEYRTKPFRISFIPSVDPSLETPLVSRKPSVRKKKSNDSEKNGIKKLDKDNRSAHTLLPPGSPTAPESGANSPRFRGPKLTLTTADLPLSASSNSTPIIDKPHPSKLSSAIERTTRITDESNNTIAKLTIEMPSSRFLPGDNIAMKLTLQLRDDVPLPKGMGARVIETRCLATEDPNGEPPEQEVIDDEEQLPKTKVVGDEHQRVLTGKKYIFHHLAVVPITSETSKTSEDAPHNQDNGLAGGKQLVEELMVTLPPFQTFIGASLLPTAILPLGDPESTADLITDLPSPSDSRSNGNGKAVDKAAALVARARSLYFRVSHMVQITVPMTAGTHHWYQPAKAGLGDLEVTVPIIFGNKNPNRNMRAPELRITDFGKRRSSGEESGSGGSFNYSSTAGSTSRAGDGGEWKAGMKFLTLREAGVKPAFFDDF